MSTESITLGKLVLHQRTAYLIHGFISKSLSLEEEEELDAWILSNETNLQVFEEITSDETILSFLEAYDPARVEKSLQELRYKIESQKKPALTWLPYAAAASVILALGLFFLTKPGSHSIPKGNSMTVISEDLKPGNSMAVLKLDNGQQIELSEGIDTVIHGVARIRNGEIKVDNNLVAGEVQEIIIPRKGNFKLVLPDGTRVWLNAASSIKYPSAFGEERRVIVTGETYFEVAKDPAHPFIVSVNGMEVKALGTAFNINAYTNEDHVRVTLAEGSVRISKNEKQIFLKPGEQLSDNESWQATKVDTDISTAWVYNQFRFKNTPVQEILKMIERWYDAQVVYTTPVSLHFTGTINRDLPVSKLLQLLEATGELKFSIHNKIITVSKS